MAASLLTLLCSAPSDVRGLFQAAAEAEGKEQTVTVELCIEGFMDFGKLKVRFKSKKDEGAGIGGGGGISHPRDISSCSYGISLLEIEESAVTMRLSLTLNYVDGRTRSVVEDFAVTRRGQKQYAFAHGIQVKAYFDSRSRKERSTRLSRLPRPTKPCSRRLDSMLLKMIPRDELECLRSARLKAIVILLRGR